MADAKLMLKCFHCNRDYNVTHDDISSIDPVRMEARILCPHCKEPNTVKCAEAQPRTPQQAMETAIKEIRAYRGEAIERAVYGAIGAATALERIGQLSTEDGANWCAAARKAGEEQKLRTEPKAPKGKRYGKKVSRK